MPNWVCSREQVKRAVKIFGSDQNSIVDRLIDGESRRFEAETRRYFIPRTESRYYRWPQRDMPSGVLWLDQDILSVTSLKAQAQDATPVTIPAADYFLEPINQPPYNRVEIDLSSSSVFASGSTPQRSVEVVGVWGYSGTTKAAGTVTSGLASDAAAVSMVCSNAALIDVGDTLLCQSEQIFVSERAVASLTTTTASLNGDKAVVTVPLTAACNAGEVLKIDSEDMYVSSISGLNATVIRAWDGTVLAAHNSGATVYTYRTLTITRGVNGTTAATHANATALTKYVPEADVTEAVIASTIAAFMQEQSGWGRVVGGGDGQMEFSGSSLREIRNRVLQTYKRRLSGAV